MKKGIKFYKKFISFFLAAMMIYSMAFKGVTASASSLSMTLAYNSSWAKQATISVSVSGLTSIKVTNPDGTISRGDWYVGSNYTVSANGTYTFIATDSSGGNISKSITVNNIDTTPPNLTLAQSKANGSTTITATASDSGSGVATITKPDGSVVWGATASYSINSNSNGVYTFSSADKLGNTTTQNITVSNTSSTTDANNGDWSAESVTIQNTNEAQLMVRVGDIDNFGFGWSSVNPFSGVETAVHSFPFTPGNNDPQGTDRIMTVTGYNTKYTTVGTNTDGYTRSSTSYAKTVNPIVMNYNSYLSGVSVQNATIQMFLDDFQPGKAHGVTQGTVQYTATMNGVEIPELSNVINNLDESGPIGKLVTFQIPERYLDLIRTGSVSIKFDDTNNCTGDGYAIDFVKLLINKTDATINTATVTGNVKDGSNNNNIQGATVSAGGVVTTTTDANGNYTLNNVPAGQAIVTASKSGYDTATITIPTVIAGGGYTANFTLTQSPPPTTPIISATPTTLTNDKVTATINYSSDSSIQQYRIDIGGVTGEWKIYNGSFDVTQNCVIEAQGINQYGNESKIASYTVSNIDKTPPTLTLSESPTNSTSGTVTISATATDNIAVASITKPDTTVVIGSSTTYTVSANGTYTFAATDTAGNVATQSININNIEVSSANDTSLPNITASLESVTPNPAKSSDEINVKYKINTVPFSLSSGMINEAEVLVDMSQAMKSNQRFSELQNGFVNQVINDSNLSGIKLGLVGYNDSVYIGNRSNYTDPKSCVMQQTDENLSNINKSNFLPLYNLNDANTKDGYRQFYQNGYIYNNISNDDGRQFGSALKAADKVLTDYGTPGAKKAIIIISSGNLKYSDDQIESIIGKGYKVIVLDISNLDNTNIKDTYIKLCGNEFGVDGNYYKGTVDNGSNYNFVDTDMKNVDASLKGVTNVTTLSINDAKLNIDLGENFEAVAGGGLEGSGKVCTVTIPQINFTYNSTTDLWEQAGTIEANFKIKSENGKYGELGFGLYTNADNTTKTNSSTISYTNFYNVATSKIIETPTIDITKEVKILSPPVITSPTDGTITKNNKPTITGTADANVIVNVYDGAILIGTVTADGNGKWTLTPVAELSDGAHAITATATDGSGNVSQTSNTVNITIDTTPPTLTLTQDPTTSTNGTVTITATATDSGSGVASITKPDNTVILDNTTTYTVSANDTYIFKATDTAGNVTTQSINVSNIIAIPSSILAHGLYNGSVTSISTENPLSVTNSIPVTMAMEVDSESSNPVINWAWSCTDTDNSGSKIIDNSIVFNKYEILDDGTLGNLQTVTFNNDQNITLTGLTMEKGKKYVIVYTITAVGSGQVTVSAAADGTMPKDATLNIGSQPDLF